MLLIGGFLMLGLFGCSAKKYRVDYGGDKDFFKGAKDEYRAGEKVTVYYDLIATDTDYTFLLDGKQINPDYSENKGYIITFKMPDHDVKLKVNSRNSMLPIECITVTFTNEINKSDVWILPETEENLKTTLWGEATAADLEKDESREVNPEPLDGVGTYILRIIDEDQMYYSANGITLKDRDKLVLRKGDNSMTAILDVFSVGADTVQSYTVSMARL